MISDCASNLSFWHKMNIWTSINWFCPPALLYSAPALRRVITCERGLIISHNSVTPHHGSPPPARRDAPGAGLPRPPGQVPPPLCGSPQAAPWTWPSPWARAWSPSRRPSPSPWSRPRAPPWGAQAAPQVSHRVCVRHLQGEQQRRHICVMIRMIFQECHTVYEKECTTETKHKYKERSSNNLKGIRLKCREDLFCCNFRKCNCFDSL